MSAPLPLDGRCPGCGYMHLVADANGVITCTWEECPEPTLVHDLLSKRDQHVHLALFREDGYTVQHPLIERLRPEGLFACDLDEEFRALTAPIGIGMFRIPPGGTLADAEQVDRDSVQFEVPEPVPESEEVRQSGAMDPSEVAARMAAVYPIGSVNGMDVSLDVPEGWMVLDEERAAIPEDCTDLLAFIADRDEGSEDGRWPYRLDDGTPAVPAARDFGGSPNEQVRLILRVK